MDGWMDVMDGWMDITGCFSVPLLAPFVITSPFLLFHRPPQLLQLR
jgi:hypothetical protein